MKKQAEKPSSRSHLRSPNQHKVEQTFEPIAQQPALSLRPTSDDRNAWQAYWKAQSKLWRTEPEIDAERQEELAQRRTIVPNIEKGIYPFKGMKLSRADVEWLLATHENGYGPIIWSYESQQVKVRDGLDLRGADLRQVDLHGLPLARMIGGLKLDDWSNSTNEQRNKAGALMQGVNLKRAHLEGAFLRAVHLEEANLFRAHLEHSHLMGAHLEKTSLTEAYLDNASLRNAIFNDEKHIAPRLADIHWGNTNLAVVAWASIKMLGDELEAGRWEMNKRKKIKQGETKEKEVFYEVYWTAIRANRQLAVALQSQGLNEFAGRFAYRAHVLRRRMLRSQITLPQERIWFRVIKLGHYLFSLFFDLLAGYGFRPISSIIWYLVIVIGFALAYYAFGHIPPLEAFVFSLTSFHGRGFFPGNNISLSDPRVVLAAFEAVIGLLIEISFIATFTQRFFGK